MKGQSSLKKIKKEDAQEERDWWHDQLSHLNKTHEISSSVIASNLGSTISVRQK
jgi:hypothetical protein